MAHERALADEALQTAEQLAELLGLRYGEVRFNVVDGRVTLIRRGETIRGADRGAGATS